MNDYLEILFTLIQNTAFQAGLFVVGSLVVAKIVDWIITSVLSRLASRTDSTIDDRIIQILHRPIYYSILFIGLGISIQLFQLPEIITFVLIGLFKTTAIFIWSIALFQSFMHFINWYSRHNTAGESIVQPHTLPLFDNIGKVVIFLVAVYFVLISWKINVTGLLASTTVLAAILGFAAKDTVANLFAGFLVYSKLLNLRTP